jgi:hypothetical protein
MRGRASWNSRQSSVSERLCSSRIGCNIRKMPRSAKSARLTMSSMPFTSTRPRPPMEAHRRAAVHPPSVRSDFDGTPVLVGEIEIDVPCVLSDPDVDGALRRVKLRSRLE